ncbi:hypothetical protein FIBSPDRAFT_539604 [Athelia psychrophila]|uniref:Uncharacterized protein n=1 Tax=Athelia psychrophila TaxID=1759441 RepID=A0A166J381_9AGAM|nr:hypothetical protein FIBSPDRAFT_539604 [Fibularhizoctonia sp. CBS 109695]
MLLPRIGHESLCPASRICSTSLLLSCLHPAPFFHFVRHAAESHYPLSISFGVLDDLLGQPLGYTRSVSLFAPPLRYSFPACFDRVFPPFRQLYPLSRLLQGIINCLRFPREARNPLAASGPRFSPASSRHPRNDHRCRGDTIDMILPISSVSRGAAGVTLDALHFIRCALRGMFRAPRPTPSTLPRPPPDCSAPMPST